MMIPPLVTVVVETITARFDCATGSLAEDLAATLGALDSQTYPQGSIERLVILDSEVPPADRSALERLHPGVRIISSEASNYFDAKNAGAAAAAGAFVALLDGDCQPAPDWLETLVRAFRPGVAAVAGRTRYSGRGWAEQVFSVPDFAYVLDEGGGRASGFNINNVLFRTEVLRAHPFDGRIARNGGCYFLFHQLRAAGAIILYEPRAIVGHGNDIAGLGFVRKHFDRGYDGVSVYRLDEQAVLRGTNLFRRFGPLALVGFFGRRILLDWQRLLRHRRQIGIAAVSLPLYCGIAALLRLIELCGALSAAAFPPRLAPANRSALPPRRTYPAPSRG
jgi:glycosyltransferase involved in cell wall biosynthesis